MSYRNVIKFNECENLVTNIKPCSANLVLDSIDDSVSLMFYIDSISRGFANFIDYDILSMITESKNIKHIKSIDNWESNIEAIEHDVTNALYSIKLDEEYSPVFYYPPTLISAIISHLKTNKNIKSYQESITMSFKQFESGFVLPRPTHTLYDKSFAIVFTNNTPSIFIDYNISVDKNDFLLLKSNITLDESKIIVIDNITTDINMFK